jgi:glycosyltransferase involved in cell wall biosynthesis
MKIAFIAIKSMPYGGGIEKSTEEVGSILAKRGHEVLVYCGSLYGKSARLYRGMKIRKIGALRAKSLQKVSLSLFATLHLLAKENPDIAHFHTVGSYFSLLPRLKGIKTVAQIHSREWKKGKWNALVKMFLRLSDYPSCKFPNEVIAVSQVLKKYYEEKYCIKVSYIPNGVDTPRQRQTELIKEMGLYRDSYILYMGRISREKGVHLLIDAYNQLKPDKALVLAGDFADDKKYENLVRQQASSNTSIYLLGFVKGQLQEELFSNAYLYVLPSEIEGLPISLLEAMSYGNSCLVSDIPENLEALNGHGYTFRNRDSRDLKEVLSLLLGRKDLVEAKKDGARRHVMENYSWDRIVDRYEELYTGMLAGSASKL